MADSNEMEKDSVFEPADKIESFLLGFVAFIQNFLRTLRDLAFKQTKFSQVTTGELAGAPYTKPVTFITLISFMAIRIFRFGMLTALLALSVPSCTAETWTKPNYPSVFDELRIPSFTEFILYGIPTLIIALLISQLLKFVLLKKRDRSGKSLVAASYYLVGFQYIVYLVMFLIISLASYLLLKFIGLTADPELKDKLAMYRSLSPSVIALIFILYISFMFYRLFSKTIHPSELRIAKRGWRQIWLFLWCFILLVITTLSAAGMAYSLAKIEVQDRKAKPVLTINLIRVDQTNIDKVFMDLLVTNNSNDKVLLISYDVVTYGGYIHLGEITKSCVAPAQVPAIVLQSKEACVLTLSLDRLGDVYIPPSYPPSLKNIVQFKTIDAKGINGTIAAIIYDGENEYSISTIEQIPDG